MSPFGAFNFKETFGPFTAITGIPVTRTVLHVTDFKLTLVLTLAKLFYKGIHFRGT